MNPDRDGLPEKPRGKRASKFKGAEQESQSRLVDLKPLNDNQRLYINALKSSDQVIVCGYSGTGKTYIAATYAANMYASREIDKIVITRPNVSVGKDLGFFPGTLEEKMAPWAAPVVEVLIEQLGKGVVETGMKNGNIEVAPLSTMRGRSFKNAYVILDEGSNTTVPEMMMFLTRIGKNCKVVINGDVRQQDIKEQSGLSKVLHLIKKYNMPIPVVEFAVEDIVRSDMVREWIKVFTEEKLM
jgi:phosphate starvation-inducible protein PhoH and related proteins